MLWETELRRSLREATSLALDLSERRITIRDFVDGYNNFYYEWALDGHEADEEGKRCLLKYGGLISFHEIVQTEIVDLVYLGNESRKAEFQAVGRMAPSEAANRISALTKQFDLPRWLQRLEETR